MASDSDKVKRRGPWQFSLCVIACIGGFVFLVVLALSVPEAVYHFTILSRCLSVVGLCCGAWWDVHFSRSLKSSAVNGAMIGYTVGWLIDVFVFARIAANPVLFLLFCTSLIPVIVEASAIVILVTSVMALARPSFVSLASPLTRPRIVAAVLAGLMALTAIVLIDAKLYASQGLFQ